MKIDKADHALNKPHSYTLGAIPTADGTNICKVCLAGCCAAMFTPSKYYKVYAPSCQHLEVSHGPTASVVFYFGAQAVQE